MGADWTGRWGDDSPECETPSSERPGGRGTRQYGMRPFGPRQYGMRPFGPRQYGMRPGPRQYGMRPFEPRQYGMRPYEPRQYGMRPAMAGDDAAGGVLDVDEWSADIAALFCADSALIRLGARLLFDVDYLPIIAMPLALVPEYLPAPQTIDATTPRRTPIALRAGETELQASAAQSRTTTVQRRVEYRRHALVVQLVIPNTLMGVVVADPEVASVLKQDLAQALAIRADHAFLHGDDGGPAPRGITRTPTVQRLAGPRSDLLTAARAMVTRLSTGTEARFADAGWVIHPDALDQLTRLQTTDNLVASAGGHSLDSARILERDGRDGGSLLGFPFVVSTATEERLGVPGTPNRIYFSSAWGEAWIGAEGGLVTVDVSAEARFETDETVLRAVMHHDFIVRKPDSFIYTDPPI
jgi:hypothetical protein